MAGNTFGMRQDGTLYPFGVVDAVGNLFFLRCQFNILVPDLFGSFLDYGFQPFIFQPQSSLSQANRSINE
jgi:hypothetical protein